MAHVWPTSFSRIKKFTCITWCHTRRCDLFPLNICAETLPRSLQSSYSYQISNISVKQGGDNLVKDATKNRENVFHGITPPSRRKMVPYAQCTKIIFRIGEQYLLVSVPSKSAHVGCCGVHSLEQNLSTDIADCTRDEIHSSLHEMICF